MINKLKCKLKRGDTLIEVTIAIGIFSMIAIMAVLVVNTSISGTQAALENTVTREEINTSLILPVAVQVGEAFKSRGRESMAISPVC